MKVVSYPGCCTAKILMGFGQETNAAWEARPAKLQTVEEMKVEADKLIRGYMIGRHNGIVSACLTSRQTRGIQALTELGFHSSGAKVKNGHRESQLLTFYINPAEYLDANPQPYQSPTAVQEVKRLVKDLKPEMLKTYNRLLRLARTTWNENFRAAAREILNNPENFS